MSNLNTIVLNLFRWEFRTEDYDIGFGVVYYRNGKKEVPVVPIKRVNAHQVAQDDSLTCEEVGTCKFGSSWKSYGTSLAIGLL